MVRTPLFHVGALRAGDRRRVDATLIGRAQPYELVRSALRRRRRLQESPVIRGSYLMIVLFALPRFSHAQPADAGVPDTPGPAAPPEAAAPPTPPEAGATPPPPPAPSTEEPPRITHQSPPIFPDVPKARQKLVDVVVHVEVDAGGSPANPRVISQPNPPFDDLAIASVLSWTFDPARSGGQPVASHLNVTVHFDPSAPGGETITVQGTLNALERGHQAAPSVGAQDVHIEAGKLATEIPHKDATELLGWAPGFLLTNEGGEGHAEQIFLRGFDAREGQDIEMRVNGDVVNQVGNLHGNGYADLHFIIPELVQSLRVVEGPYDPRQGNFAVAGSADYELGLTQRGLTASYETGSYGTQRALLLWGSPTSNSHNFAGVELYQTNGFGENRDARRATALGQLEDKLGEDGLWRLTSGAYITDYHSAGVIREDDYAAHRIGFYDTYDPNQGGAASRAFVLGDLEFQHKDYTTHHQLSFTAQTLRLREDFTGFLLDQQEAVQTPHDQRGDLIDLESDAITLQEQSWMRRHLDVAGLAQELEFGLFGRLDATSGQQYRLFTLATPPYPYHKEADLDAVLGDVGLYGAANAKLAPWAALRGGVRADLFTYDVLDNCAVQSVAHPSPANPPGDASCLSQADMGRPREPVQRSTTAGAIVLPRASLVLGPFFGLSPSVSIGRGVRSIDPPYITQDRATPFAQILSYEGGLAYKGSPGDLDLELRASGFRTHVDQDLVFSETVGRNVLANGTTRLGSSLSGRLRGPWFDQNASVTVVRSTFDDTGLLIPYVPDVVVRSDSVVFSALPWQLGGQAPIATAGLGVTYVGPRALPYGERSDTIFTIDGSASLAWTRYKLGVKASNLLDTRYRLGEYNYRSDFHLQDLQGVSAPTLTVARHFTAGAPRIVIFQLEMTL
jgi:iron complex outermembrane recepter protein